MSEQNTRQTPEEFWVAIRDAAESAYSILEKNSVAIYLVLEDHGWVEPLYDPEVLGDEWEVFT